MIHKKNETDKIIALCGNPNVGKSTIFNTLTGMRRHTGNWTGKTVTAAGGYCEYNGQQYIFADLPGCYSLMAHSAEEETAREFICRGESDAVVVVCDATCLERSLNLVLQVLEMTPNVAVCINLMDEARKKKISIDLKKLSDSLGVPVTGSVAGKKSGLRDLMNTVESVAENPRRELYRIQYPNYIEEAVARLEKRIKEKYGNTQGSRRTALMLLQEDGCAGGFTYEQISSGLLSDEELLASLAEIKEEFAEQGITPRMTADDIVSAIVKTAENICRCAVRFGDKNYMVHGARADRILTGKLTAFPIMLLALLGVFWFTIKGANYPSQLIADFLFWIEGGLLSLFNLLGAPKILSDMLITGVYRVLAWVVAVMLPPMAVFFPLFTLLEDLGALPRAAFNLDRCFKKCRACGKQALTMCMGFGCNSVGVTGCRIIDSPRERLIAIITNSFVPCNGRFPAIIAVITMFFVGGGSELVSALFLTGVIVLSALMTLAASWVLSRTILKGTPSSFTLELPPFRKPQIGKVIVRSVRDRTLFVLGRAVTVAAPAGLVIWLTANVYVGDMTLLAHCAGFLDPFAQLLGMDGIILMSFILGFPANEIVIPVMIMAYTADGSLSELSTQALRQLLVDNGWTWLTAANVVLFSLMHWPCSTTCLTIKKETQSLKWTAISILVPTAAGFGVCFVFTTLVRLFS